MKDNINKNINQYNSAVNPDEIWSAIEGRVDEINAKKKKKRRGLFFFFSGLGFVFLLSSVIYFYNENSSTVKANNTLQETQQEVTSSSRNKINTTHSQSKVKNDDTEKANAAVAEPAKHEEAQTELKEKNSQKINENSIKRSSSPTAANIKSESYRKNEANPEVIKQQSIPNNNVSQKNIDDSQVKLEHVEQGDKSQPMVSLDEKRQRNILSRELNKPKTAGEELTINTETTVRSVDNEANIQSNTINKQGAAERKIGNTQVSGLDMLKIAELINDEKIITYNPLDVVIQNRKHTTQEKPFVFSLGVNAGMFSINRNMSETAPISDTYRKLRLGTESTLEAIEFGANVAIEHKSGLSLSLGFGRVDINERFDSQNVTTEIKMVDDVEFLVINLMQDTVKVYGSIPETTTTTTTYEVYNQYRLIELPIVLGYQHQLNQWKMGAQVGVLANVSFATKGRIFNEVGSVVKISEEEGRYKDRISLGYQFGLSIERPIVGNLSLQIAPMVKFYPNVLSDNQTLSKKYTLLGGQVGLSYKFN